MYIILNREENIDHELDLSKNLQLKKLLDKNVTVKNVCMA